MSISTAKIILTAENFQELKKIQFLPECLVLSHIMNTIRSSQRLLLLNSAQPDSPAKTRDTVFGLLSMVSFVYAGIARAARILTKLAHYLPNLQDDFAWVINEHRQDHSLFNTTLKKIRDQLVFHFDLQIGDDVLKNAIKKYPPVFAEGASSRVIDMSYTLADNVVTQLLAVYDSSPGSPEEKVSKLVQQLSEYNVKLCEVLDKVIAELICENHAYGLLGKS